MAARERAVLDSDGPLPHLRRQASNVWLRFKVCFTVAS
jgi:hypothetical protein